MKNAISFVIILLVHTASASCQRDRPAEFTEELTRSYEILIDCKDFKNKDQFNKAYVVPWKTIRAKIQENNPSVPLVAWGTDIKNLIEDLHTTDHQWFGNKKLKENSIEWGKYELEISHR